MRHKIIRLILGAVILVVGIVQLVRGNNMQGALFALVGAAFLFSGFRLDKYGKQ